jgi:hypothetical protein
MAEKQTFSPGVGCDVGVDIKERKTKIYALCDENGEVRYIGKTSQSLANRMSGHLFDARHGDKVYRSKWIHSMWVKGFVPPMCLIEEVCGDGYDCEVAWIKYYREHLLLPLLLHDHQNNL